MEKILLIDESSDLLANIAEYLKLRGYNVMVASGGKMGILLLGFFEPDLIICDILMPDIDGYQVFKSLKESRNTKGIPFIFCSALPENASGVSMAGADVYITKPFHPGRFTP